MAGELEVSKFLILLRKLSVIEIVYSFCILVYLYWEGACRDRRVVWGVATDCSPSLTTVRVRLPDWAWEKVASNLGGGGGG